MTQDLGTAFRRFEDNRLDDMIYVVGNEQNYHFQVLKLVLKKLGYADWSDHITHLSYGMVELPEGKMKSREGTVVDADDLIEGMVSTAREMSAELGKLDGCSEEEANAVSTMVGLGALKYFILKVDPKKTMLFDPRESIDFNGNTGPFIQYTHARIRSVLRKAAEAGIDFGGAATADYLREEIDLVKSLTEYPSVVKSAGENFAPSVVGQAVQWLLPRPFDPQGGERRGAHDASPAGAAGRPRHQGGHETAGYRRPRTHVTHSVIMKNGGFSETSVFSCR